MSSSVLEHNFSFRLARELELVADKLEQWISAEHKWPFDPTLLQQLQQLLGLLKHEVQRLKAGKVYVVIVLMGGTGVGKSTLLNALAGQPIARTGLLRPTTRQVLAYIHTGLPGDTYTRPVIRASCPA
jgi:tRNA U34 5-carboxymethylaminomethyl modifying GTPase MnmE/TrmE